MSTNIKLEFEDGRASLTALSDIGVVIRVRTANRSIQNLRLDCPDGGAGWLVSYNGGKPHCGSLGGASPGTKLMVQVIGPKKWELTYTDD